MSDEQENQNDRGRFSQFALDHKIFSGLVGSGLVAVIALLALLVNSHNDSGESEAGPTEQTSTQVSSGPPPLRDTDIDGVSDSRDRCRDEAGEPPSGCPDSDGDGLTDNLDKCPQQPADTRDGCRVPADVTTIGRLIENEGSEYLRTDNVGSEQVSVGGVIDPVGIYMAINKESKSGALTIPTNHAFREIRGRVGVASEPCSTGAIGYVAVRTGEGEILWPKTGKLKRVGRNAVPFKATIPSADRVVLYAQAPVIEEDECAYELFGTTAIAWVHTRLIGR